MTEHMPARIWARNPNGKCVVSFTIGDFDYKTPYIRSDIAERMADILTEARLQIEYLQVKFQHTGSGNAVLARIEEALSAFRSTTQDTEARYDDL